MDRLLFRVDGSEETGMGHIFRTVNLAKEIRKIEQNAGIIFLIKENKFAKDYLDSNGFEVESIPDYSTMEEEINDIFRIIKKYFINKIIVDKFDVNVEYMNELKKANICIVQFFYGDASSINADIGINPNLGCLNDEIDLYRETKLLIGGKYVLINENFQNANFKMNENINEIFISFGAGDKNNITPSIIELLDKYFNQKNIGKLPVLNIVIGPVYSNVDKIIEKVMKIKLEAKLIFNYLDLSSIMKGADVAITSVGGTVYELISLYVPILGILQSGDQEKVAKYLDENKCIINLGYIDQLKPETFFLGMDQVYSREERMKMLNAASKLIDGKGAQRCAKEVLKLKKNI